MPLTRFTFFSTAFLLRCFCWLVLGAGLALPAAARPQRAHRLHHNHLRRRIHIPRMLPTFIPAAREGYSTVLRGRASWYGRQFQGARTTSGERFNRFAYTCAHKTLPFGTRLRVTNLKTGQSVVVRVSDRGPFRHERILDLAEIAARPLGLVEAGAATVVAEIVPRDTPLGLTDTPGNLPELRAGDPNPHAPFTAYLLPEVPTAEATPVVAAAAAVPAIQTPTPAIGADSPSGPLATASATPGAGQFLVQAGIFADPLNARAMLARILTIDQTLAVEVATVTVEGRPLNRVMVGQLDNWLAAETVRRNLQLWGIAGLVYQLPAHPAGGTEQLAGQPVPSTPLAVTASLK